MKDDARVQERWVREELGFVRPGEVVFVFPSARDADFELLRDRTLPASQAAPRARKASNGDSPKDGVGGQG